MNSFVKKVVLGTTITLSAVSAQAHCHGFWGGVAGGLIGGMLAPRPVVVPVHHGWGWGLRAPVLWETSPLIVSQPQPVIVQQQIPVQQPVFVNQAQAQPQQPVFLNQPPVQQQAPEQAQEQAQPKVPELKPGETWTCEVKPDGTKVYKLTRQEVALPQQDAARVREN